MQVTIFDPSSKAPSADTRLWADDAACKRQNGHDPAWWFPLAEWSNRHPHVKQAKAVCRDCPVMGECLDYALEHEAYGIWGGMTEQERERFRRSNGLSPMLWRRNRQRKVGL